jgi:ketosteroid isomerase-like protein
MTGHLKLIIAASIASLTFISLASRPLFAASPPAADTRRQIADALHSLEAALARGDNATQISHMLYANDDRLTGEGETASTRGMADTIKDVQGWMDSLGPGGTKGCKYTILDPVVSSATTFSSFLLLHCKANPPILKDDQELRMMYVWKKQAPGWRVVLEMYESGKM